MAIRNVVQSGDEILRKKSKPVRDFDEKLWELLDDMRDTMYQFDGMGLAAVQVGVLKRVVIMEVNNMFFELINPEIISSEGETIEQEGCLSCGKQRDYVERPYKVTVVEREFERLGVDPNRVILVYNKVDKITDEEVKNLVSYPFDTCYISAKNGKNVVQLKAMIREKLTANPYNLVY